MSLLLGLIWKYTDVNLVEVNSMSRSRQNIDVRITVTSTSSTSLLDHV